MYLIYYRNFAGRVVSAKLEEVPTNGSGKPSLVIEASWKLSDEDSSLKLSQLEKMYPFPITNIAIKEPDNGQKKNNPETRGEDSS